MRPTLLILLSLVAFRALSLVPLAIDVDEAWFSASAHGLAHPFDFFTRAIDNKPPGTVWFYWVAQHLASSGPDPRIARAFGIVIAVVTTYLISRLVDRDRAPLAAIAFLAASVLPSPKLLAPTTEMLMLPCLALAALAWLKELRDEGRGELMLSAGIAFGFAFLLKQTLLFFVPMVAWCALERARHDRTAALLSSTLFLAGALGVLAIATAGLGLGAFWYWSYTYPSTVLSSARANLFDGWGALGLNTLFFALSAWPLVRIDPRKCLAALPREQRGVVLLWAAGAIGTVIIGRGLFFHYYLFLIPPLVMLYDGRGKGGLVVASVATCVVAAIPVSGTFWGTDLDYYARLGERIRQLSPGDERIFVWGGNALPLVTSARKHATRFVTSRFAAAPYATEATRAMFHVELESERPRLIVDLHERGDDRFDVAPQSDPWLAHYLERHYKRVRDPLIPWAAFYLRDDRKTRVPASNIPDHDEDYDALYARVNRELGWPLSSFDANSFRLARNCIALSDHVLALEGALRAWEGLRALSALGRSGEDSTLRATRVALGDLALREAGLIARGRADAAIVRADRQFADRTLQWLERQFKWKETRMPMAIESRAWWVSFALVKLQPKMDSPALRIL